MDTKIKYVSDDRRYKIVIIILVSIIVLFYVAIPIYRKLLNFLMRRLIAYSKS